MHEKIQHKSKSRTDFTKAVQAHLNWPIESKSTSPYTSLMTRFFQIDYLSAGS
ncbi:MAG: hypothetical protein OXJ52_08715 [Oligoflexia bacterium]|nr:hypothetical protein [Oligoflexia bacterium]